MKLSLCVYVMGRRIVGVYGWLVPFDSKMLILPQYTLKHVSLAEILDVTLSLYLLSSSLVTFSHSGPN